jgi:parallel beta-helix repeat protein
MKAIFAGIILVLLLTGMLALAFNIRHVKASGTIYIRADGSIDPPDAPISSVDNVTYTLTGNITSDADGIVVERSNIIVDGAGYTVQGTGAMFSRGIYLSDGGKVYYFNVTIKNVKIVAFWYGILFDSSNNCIFGNNITNNEYGFWIESSSNNIFRNNSVTSNRYGFFVYGVPLSQYIHDIDASNTVGGKPVYYWVNKQNAAIPANAGYVGLVNCTNIIVENLRLENNGQGILLAYTTNSTIRQNTITHNRHGIELHESSNNNLTGNSMISNNENGLALYGSSNNSITRNNIVGNSLGMELSNSLNNSIIENDIANNTGGMGGILLAGSSNNTILGNNIISNNLNGVWLEDSSNYNNICENNITNNNESGISFCFWPGSQAWNNSISGNNIAHNKESGIRMYASNGSVISGNNIIKNGVGISLIYSSKNNVTENSIANNFVGIIIDTSGNMIYHNNFIDNTYQVDSHASLNIWDDGYPSGGNYWNDYAGTDVKSGRNQDQPGSDGIGDIPYVINEDNRDRYPLMRARVSELVTSVMAPASMRLGSSLSLGANVTNLGSNDQANVEFLLLINNTIVGSTTIPLLKAGSSYTLGYLWTPTVEGTYNVTAYAHPVTDEPFTENNQKTTFIAVVQVGVEAGNWIKLGYTITGAPSGTPLPQWIKIEFLSVEGTSATVRVTMHMSDGTEPSQTMSIDVVAGGGTFQGLSGFVIPANCTTGDSIYITGYGNITIAGETTRTYAGAGRTVVYASVSQYGTQLTYYWDKLTGAMVEASVVSGGVTATGKATETNMWQAAPSGLPIEPIYLYILAALAIIIAVGAAAFIVRRKKKRPEEAKSPQI